MVPIYRIEPLIADLLKQDLTWAEFKVAYDTAISEGLSSGRYRGAKSIIAYRTGLDVSPLSRTPDQGFQALDAIKRGLGGGSMKKLRDHLLCRAIELCMEYDVPMQIHTGMGDVEVNLVMCRPSYLLIFCGFRPIAVAGCCSCTPAIPIIGKPPIWRMCCRARISISARGFRLRRQRRGRSSRAWCRWLHLQDLLRLRWLPSAGNHVTRSAKLGKQALQDVMNRLVARGMLVEADAQTAAAGILSDNARGLYKLD